MQIEKQHTVLRILAKKFRCRTCHRTFHQRFQGVRPYRRSTEAFRRQVVSWHQEGISQRTIAGGHGLGSATVERGYQEYVDRKVRERQNDPCPRILGIDEHFFTRREGDASTFCNLERRKVFDVALGRSETALQGYLGRLLGKDRVRLVCLDLSETYRTLVRRHFPKAQIVADRFRVIRLVGHAFLMTWKILDPRGRANRGLLSLLERGDRSHVAVHKEQRNHRGLSQQNGDDLSSCLWIQKL